MTSFVEGLGGPNILIVVDVGFPYGSGATSRAYAYAQALCGSGARVKVLCVEPSEGVDGEPRPSRGTYHGIEYAYTYGRTSRPARRRERAWRKVTKWWNLYAAVRSWERQHGRVDAVILYSRVTAWAVAARVTSRAVSAPLVHEDCELPFVWSRAGARTAARRWLYEHVAFRCFDACLVISTFLEEYCAGHLRPGATTLLVPLLVDAGEVEPLPPGSGAIEETITFCGSLDHPEVRNLLESFAAVAGEFPDVTLRLIGGAKRESSLDALHRLADALGIAERLELTGRVRREDLFGLLRRARVLALPRPSGAFSTAGMPTKVGEYLVTARPVVVTANGDLPLYLRDGIDAYMPPPDDVEAFAAKLRHVLSHPEEADEVGRRGRETAAARFDAVTHGRRILAFVRTLREEALP